MEADRGPDWCPNAAMDYEVTNQIVASQQEMTVTSPTLVYRFRGQQRPPCTCDSSWAQLQNSEHWTRTLLHCAVGPPAAILAALPTASPVFPQPCLAQAPGALQGVLTAAEVNGVGTQPQGTRAGLNYSDIAAEASTAACPRDRVTMASLSLAVCNTSCLLQHQWGEQLSHLSSPQPTTQPRATEAESEWTCPICGYHQDDVAYVIPCLHQLCYGCAGHRSKQSCALCRHNIKTIQYSVRADDDYLECSAPLSKVHLDYGLQGEPELIAPEHSFPPEVWAAFLQLYPRKLRPLLQWLQREIGRISGNEWWDIHARQSIILSFLCMHRLNEAIFVAAESRRQQSVLCEEAYFHHSSPVWPRTPTAAEPLGHSCRKRAGRQSHNQPQTCSLPWRASCLGQPTSSASPGTEKLPSILHGGSWNPNTTTVPLEERKEEPEQAAVAGPSTQSPDHSPGRPQCSSKRKVSSSTQGSPAPRRRWSQWRH